MKTHETWCAKVIAINSELPFTVKCDCNKVKKYTTKIPKAKSEQEVMQLLLDFDKEKTY